MVAPFRSTAEDNPMLRDIEVYMPALSPVVLDAGRPGADPASVRGALLGGFDADQATLARSALVDLDLAAFGPAARQELAMAQGRFAAASLSEPGEPVTAGRLAVLAQPLAGARAGTLAWIQTSGTATVAWLAPGSRVHPETGGVLLPRSVLPIAAPARPRAMVHTGTEEVDTIFKFADMSKAFLPPEASAALSVAEGLIDLFTGGGPSDVEVIITAVQKAIQAAVADLESFIAQEKINDIKSVIDTAYHWLSVCAGQVKAASDIPSQLTYARLALQELPVQIAALGPALERLTTISVQADAGKELHARVRAAKLLAHGAAGLFTLQKLRIQFEAFLAVRTDAGAKAADQHRALVRIHHEAYCHDVQDGDGYVQAYRTMMAGLLKDRAAGITFQWMGYFPSPWVAMFTDAYWSTVNPYRWDDWVGAIQGLGRDPGDRFDHGVFQENANAQTAFLTADFARIEGLNDAEALMARYEAGLADWRTVLDGWNARLAA
ncbi:MAG: hypothetical protein JWR84_865 [Caulobacter sp.]|nr:hypothetical protein [Caulobacter sp.]